jgi:hypothetical protein
MTPLGLELEIADIERDELAAAQSRRPADQEQRPIAQAAQIFRDCETAKRMRLT